MKDDTYLFDLDIDVSVRDCIVATIGAIGVARVKWTAVCASMLVSTAMSVALLIIPVSQMSFLFVSSLSTMYVKSFILIYFFDTVIFTWRIRNFRKWFSLRNKTYQLMKKFGKTCLSPLFTRMTLLSFFLCSFDYGDRFWNIKHKEFPCSCGTESCRFGDKKRWLLLVFFSLFFSRFWCFGVTFWKVLLYTGESLG